MTIKNINYKSKAAYNSIFHKNRCKIEEEIDLISEDRLDPCVGIFLTDNNESMPVYAPIASCEKVISRKISLETGDHSGARIVLTRDNHGHRATGLGGAGGTKCEAIDIVAGSLTSAKEIKRGNTQSRANFAEDGARLYLTERGDVNAYFATAKSDTAGVSADSKLKSGAGLKSDHTLIIGRERVRILAGVSKYDGGERLATGNQPTKAIIEIGGTASEKHHKAVLGNNLVKYLKLMNEKITLINGKIADLQLQLVEYKGIMAVHTHQGVGQGFIQTFPDAIAAAPAFVDSVPDAMNGVTKTIMNEYNAVIQEMKAFGLENIGIEADKENKILSSTVYIGE
tara:strand:- start:12011 stop:13033 length:1023 start_codon:yes stop_codon:yes gene_type:complete